MTVNNPGNKTMPDSVQHALDAFVGFVYATTVSLVINTAYTESEFNSVMPIVITLIILVFFTLDGMARYRGRKELSQETTQDVNQVILFFLEITVVYFLLLVSLKFIKIYAHLTFVESARTWHISVWTLSEKPSGRILCYFTAVFAILSGLWNTVMIVISKQVNKEQICSFFKGHLADEIVEMFPIIKKWQVDFREEKKHIEDQVDEDTRQFTKVGVNGRSNNKSARTRTHLKKMRKFDRALGRLLFEFLVRRPHHLIVPYLLVAHIVVLNLVIGVFIVVSTRFLEGKSLLGILPFHFHVLLVLLVFLLVGTLLFFGIHFRSGENQTLFERFGCACLAITILLIYSICPVKILFFMVFCQQVAANIFMNKYFKPPIRKINPVVHEQEMVDHGSHL